MTLQQPLLAHHSLGALAVDLTAEGASGILCMHDP
jgi:hypothetical protein